MQGCGDIEIQAHHDRGTGTLEVLEHMEIQGHRGCRRPKDDANQPQRTKITLYGQQRC